MIPLKHKIADNFSKAATSYKDYAHIQKQVVQRLMRYASVFEKDNIQILDIGCGTGFLTSHLKDYYPHAHITACDISNQMLQECQKSLGQENISYLLCDAETYHFTQKFDMIASSMTFQWFDDISKTLLSYYSCLKEKGYILFSTLIGDTFHEWYDCLRQVGYNITPPIMQQAYPCDITERFILQEEFSSAWAFLKMLKKIGAFTLRDNHILSAPMLQEACKIFTKQYKNKVTYESVIVKIFKE